MKKLSLLIALIICVTIGGVYATWVFTSDDTAITDEITAGILLADVDSTATHGTLEMNDASILIDEGVGKAPVLKMSTPVILTFTPDDDASAEIKAGAIDVYVYFVAGESLTSKTYNSETIFKLSSQGVSAATRIKINAGTPTWTDNGDGTLSVDISNLIVGAQDSVLSFASNFVLDTKGEYDNFNDALGSVSIQVRVSSKDPAAA